MNFSNGTSSVGVRAIALVCVLCSCAFLGYFLSYSSNMQQSKILVENPELQSRRSEDVLSKSSRTEPATSSMPNSQTNVITSRLRSHFGELRDITVKTEDQKPSKENASPMGVKDHIMQSEKLPDALLSKSDQLLRQARDALDQVRRDILASDARRSAFETREFDDGVYAKVVISSPSPSEVSVFQERLLGISAGLPEDVLPFFIVEGQQLLEKYLLFPNSYIVLMFTLPHNGRLAYDKDTDSYAFLDEFGRYGAFSTRDHTTYQIGNESQPNGYRFIVPPEINLKRALRPWFKGNSQPLRFRHLFKGLTPESVEL